MPYLINAVDRRRRLFSDSIDNFSVSALHLRTFVFIFSIRQLLLVDNVCRQKFRECVARSARHGTDDGRVDDEMWMLFGDSAEKFGDPVSNGADRVVQSVEKVKYCYETIMFGRHTYARRRFIAGALFYLRHSHSVTSPSVVLSTKREYTLFQYARAPNTYCYNEKISPLPGFEPAPVLSRYATNWAILAWTIQNGS